jgi:hypothetical protein
LRHIFTPHTNALSHQHHSSVVEVLCIELLECWNMILDEPKQRSCKEEEHKCLNRVLHQGGVAIVTLCLEIGGSLALAPNARRDFEHRDDLTHINLLIAVQDRLGNGTLKTVKKPSGLGTSSG